MKIGNVRSSRVLSMATLTVCLLGSTGVAANAAENGGTHYDQMPAGAIDCTPYPGKTVPVECSLAPGKGENESDFDISQLPGISVTPGAAKSPTKFDLGPIIAALGKYSALAIFYVNYGDGTGFGSSGDLRPLTSFPSSHVYVQPGDYSIIGYATMDGRTESTTLSVSVAPSNQPDPTPEAIESSDWDPTATPKVNDVIPVTSTTGGLTIGTGGSVITEARSKAPAASAAKAPVVNTKANQVVIMSVPSLPKGSDIAGLVRIGTSWNALPALEVGANGVLTMPALTFSKAGTFTVKLNLETGGSKFVTVKVKK